MTWHIQYLTLEFLVHCIENYRTRRCSVPASLRCELGDLVGERATRITVAPELRDLYWLMEGGELERRFREPTTSSILLDLSKLTWADPVPLLSLACLCAEFRDRGGSLSIELGSPRSSNHQFRIFFAQHGFLATIALDTPVRWAGRTYPPEAHGELDQRLRALVGALAYQDAECIPARLIPVRKMAADELDRLIEGLVEIAHPRISSWLLGNSRRRGLMSHQLRIFLTEAIDNIQEHGYRTHGGYGAIYARIRSGRPEEPAALRSWSSAKVREERHCPTLERCRVGRRPGWLELFVCDVGVGISHDFPDEKAPLQKLSAALFSDPVSRIVDRAVPGKTNMTGLQRIGQLLLAGRDHNNRGDFVRVYSNGEWVGEHLPWPKKTEALPGLRNVLRVPNASPPTGTALHFALEPPPETAAEQATLYPSAFVAPEYDALSNVRAELARERSRDCEAQALFDVYRAPNQRFAHDLAALADAQHLDVPTFIIRPSRIQRKVDLVKQVSRMLAIESPVRDVVFTDVPWASAIDFHNIITTQSSWRQAGPHPKLRVHILSQDWFCATLSFNSSTRTFEASKDDARAFLTGTVGHPSASQAAAVLRRQDSLLFWSEVQSAYLNEPIRWRTSDEDTVVAIWGYLDLNFALANPSVFEIVRRAVRRTVSSLTPQVIHTADDIIARVLGSDFELEEVRTALRVGARHTILAGSILGSGNTMRRFVRGMAAPYAGALQVLHHPDFARNESESLLALDWLPPRPEGRRTRSTTFERVSNTPFVIRGGESAVPLARFKKSGPDSTSGKSLYGESPNEAYQRWQRLGLLRMGHWVYGMNHDLLTLRLGDALVYDAAEGGAMIGWLAARIAEWIPTGEAQPRGFVVYAQHQVTSVLARAISQHPMCRGIDFFPAAAASSQGKAALLLSPMTREAVIATCQNHLRGGGAAVILDDAVISGVTIRSITQAVEGLWEVLRDVGRVEAEATLRIHTLAIVDRSGEPAQRALVERNLTRDRRYWRWDVPSLGHSGTCALCGLHGRWQALASVVHGSLLRQRLEQWLKQWGATPVSEGRFDAGVPARRLPTQSATRFGIERNQRPHQVEHSLSVSRVSIAAEIAGATTRKDYPLRKARQALKDPNHIDTETAIEILATQLLLFQDGLNGADRAERLQLLLELLWSQPEATISTALGGMTMLIDQALVEEVWVYCMDLIERRGFPNEDTILVALGLHHLAGAVVASPLKLGSPWEVFDLCRRSSAEGRHALAMVLRVFGWSPNSVHRTTLPDRLTDRASSQMDLAQTVLMLERLADALYGIPLLAVEGSLLDPRKDSSTIRALAGALGDTRQAISQDHDLTNSTENTQLIRSLLDEAWTLLFSANGLALAYRRQLCASLTGQEAAVKVLVPAWRIIVDRWKAFVREKGAEMVTKWTALPIVWFEPADGATKPVDLYYDGTIRGAVADLMSNVVHNSGPIPCPWPEGSEVPQADLWGRLRVAADGASATIELVNGYAGNGEVRPHVSASLVHLYAMGGEVATVSDAARNLILTRITLPTAAGLTSS